MIDIKIIEKGDSRTLKLRGHAGYNPGNDVVCSAASILICTLNGYIETHPDNIEESDVYDIEDGHVDISLSGNNEFLAVFDAVKLGLRLLEQNFPNNVKLEEKTLNAT